jgi:16S rRNA (adenine1518-N6/adenine1519-N6)-dimethyltransferase
MMGEEPAGESLLRRTRALLRTHGLHPRKRHGQHFMVSRSVLARILAEAELEPGATAVEIGPGTGLLTEALLATGASVLAVEVDRGLVQLLEATLGGHPRFRIYAADALRFDFAAAVAACRAEGPVRVVANIPYQITSPLIFRLLGAEGVFDRLCLTVQREVADRLVASPGTKAYGALTLACQYRAVTRTVLRIPPAAFYPAPAVDSALVRMELLPAPAVEVGDEARLFQTIRAAFGQRRKTLRNALRHAGWSPAEVEEALAAAGVAGARRGETLSLPEFARISEALPGRAGTAGDGSLAGID